MRLINGKQMFRGIPHDFILASEYSGSSGAFERDRKEVNVRTPRDVLAFLTRRQRKKEKKNKRAVSEATRDPPKYAFHRAPVCPWARQYVSKIGIGRERWERFREKEGCPESAKVTCQKIPGRSLSPRAR